MKKILLSASFLLITGYMFATDLISGQTYRLSLGEKVLSVKDGSLANNSDVVSWTETNVNAQRWVLVFFVGFVCISTAVMLLLQERTHLVYEV